MADLLRNREIEKAVGGGRWRPRTRSSLREVSRVRLVRDDGGDGAA